MIYLDVESITATLDPHRANDYVTAWIAAVRADRRYRPGVYCPRGLASTLLDTDPTFPVWVVAPNAAINPIDALGEIAPIDFSGQNLPVTIWQYALDVSGATLRAAHFRFLDDQATATTWTDTAAIDFDLATCLDPARPDQINLTKSPRTVTTVMAAATTVTAGDSTQITITLDRAAPQPLGTTLVLRSDRPEAQVRAIAHIAAGDTSVTVPVSTSPVTTQISTELAARALHDLRSNPATAPLTVTPPSN